MKAYLEYLVAPPDSSWTLFDRRLDRIPFEWHCNSEYELTLLLNSRGQRFVGDDISPYDHGDLVLIAPKIPHTWCSSEAIDSTRQHQAIVLWFTEAFLRNLIDQLIELRSVRRLFDRSSRAVNFSPKVRWRAAKIIRKMLDQAPPQRLIALFELLLLLAGDGGARPITSPRQATTSSPDPSEERIGRVVSYLHANYHQEIEISKLTRLAALSRSSLFRLFKQQTKKTISQYVSQLRIANACALLLTTQKPIATIADEVGYNNLAHFNRQFRFLRRLTPREFREAFEEPISGT